MPLNLVQVSSYKSKTIVLKLFLNFHNTCEYQKVPQGNAV